MCSLLQDVMRRRLVAGCRSFRTTWTLEDGTNRLSRSVGIQLPTYAAQRLRRTKAFVTLTSPINNDYFSKEQQSAGSCNGHGLCSL